MCVTGVARELAAHFSLPLDIPEPNAATSASVASDITVVIDDDVRCPRYLGRVARVAMGPSPAWMAQRLVKAGMRPISNVVDVTNYVLLERNQPLHAFDLAKLGGRGIVVRTAAAGEKITTLDGVERELTGDDLLICDAERVPQAVAGIMGGATAEVSDTTTEILLESAYFERMGIALTSKRLKLRSESSARFERGIDPDAIARNAERAMELLVEVAGAQVAADAVDVYPRPVERERIRLRASRVNAVLGTALDAEDVWDSLAPLGIELDSDPDATDGDTVVAIVPTFRPDLDREIDLVEEVARRIGFDRIGRTLPDTHGQVGALTLRQRERRLVADALVGAGFSEAITLSLVSPADLERAGAPLDRLVRATNPLRSEESVLRTAVLPGLLRALAGNRNQGLPDVALFEMGRVFLSPVGDDRDGPLPDEPEQVAFAWSGHVRRRPVEDDRPVDVYDAVDAVRAVLGALGVADVSFEPVANPGFRAGRAATVTVSGVAAGTVGEISPTVLDALHLEAPVVGAELVLDTLLDAPRRDRTFRAPSRFPASLLDLAFVADQSVAAASIEATLRAELGDVLEAVRCFDDYRSDELAAAGKRSLAFSAPVAGARPHPRRHRGRRAANPGGGRGRAGARRRAARVAGRPGGRGQGGRCSRSASTCPTTAWTTSRNARRGRRRVAHRARGHHPRRCGDAHRRRRQRLRRPVLHDARRAPARRRRRPHPLRRHRGLRHQAAARLARQRPRLARVVGSGGRGPHQFAPARSLPGTDGGRRCRRGDRCHRGERHPHRGRDGDQSRPAAPRGGVRRPAAATLAALLPFAVHIARRPRRGHAHRGPERGDPAHDG
ncbi:MAG: phenylalanine--tRNA ligase subunit beta [Acidimicrobiia bacterium]